MYPFCSSGLRPRPAVATGDSVSNGLATKLMRPVKKTAIPISTATTTGISSRLRDRFVKTAIAANSDKIHVHSSSDPAWLAHSDENLK